MKTKMLQKKRFKEKLQIKEHRQHNRQKPKKEKGEIQIRKNNLSRIANQVDIA